MKILIDSLVRCSFLWVLALPWQTVHLSAETPDLAINNLSMRGTLTATAANDLFLRFLPPGRNPKSGTFNFSSQSTPNQFGESRPNDVFRLSYNMTPGGGMENPEDGSFGYEFETHYAPSATERFFEHHLSYFSPSTGANYRPWSWAIFKSSTNPALVDRIEHSVAVDKLSLLNRDYQNQYMVFQPMGNKPGSGGEVSLIGPTVFVALQNNYSPFIQLGPSGASRSLIFLDDRSRIRLGSSGDPVSLNEKLLWEQDGAFDIGQAADSRPRDLFVARDARIGGALTVAGKVGIGIPDPAFKLHVNGSVAGVGPYRNLSDERLKTNVTVIRNPLHTVLSLRGVQFEWKTNMVDSEAFEPGTHLGFIAQEVERVLPEAVAKDARGTLNIAYGDIVPVLVEAIREQTVRHASEMEAKNRELEELKQRVLRLEELTRPRSEPTR